VELYLFKVSEVIYTLSHPVLGKYTVPPQVS
jgi:hypothetical protein